MEEKIYMDMVAKALERAEATVEEAQQRFGSSGEADKRALVHAGIKKKRRAMRALKQMSEQCFAVHVANRTRSAKTRDVPVAKVKIHAKLFLHQTGEAEFAKLEGRAPRVALATKAVRKS